MVVVIFGCDRCLKGLWVVIGSGVWVIGRGWVRCLGRGWVVGSMFRSWVTMWFSGGCGFFFFFFFFFSDYDRCLKGLWVVVGSGVWVVGRGWVRCLGRGWVVAEVGFGCGSAKLHTASLLSLIMDL